MVGEASSQEGFMQQAQMYLNNPQQIILNKEFWIIIGCLCLLGIGIWLWFRKNKGEQK
jgi:hypothetical protein